MHVRSGVGARWGTQAKDVEALCKAVEQLIQEVRAAEAPVSQEMVS